MTELPIASVDAPSTPVYRVSRIGAEPFGPPPWDKAGANRFDDPERSYRVIYVASNRAGAFGESLARYRRSLSLLALMQGVEDDEPLDQALAALLDPADERRGVVPFDWRFRRQIGATILDPPLVFADILDAGTISHLRVITAPVSATIGIRDFDLSTVLGPERAITQACAQYIHSLHDEQGTPRFAGIRYRSRLNDRWTCWAIFDDRLVHTPQRLETTINLDDADFLAAAHLLDLSIESVRGQGEFVRP